MHPEKLQVTVALILIMIVAAACGAREERVFTYPTPTVVPPQAQVSQAELGTPEVTEPEPQIEDVAQQPESIVAVPVQQNPNPDNNLQEQQTDGNFINAVPVPSITPLAGGGVIRQETLPQGAYVVAQPITDGAVATATERAFLAANPPTPPPAPTYYLPPEFFLSSMGAINRPVQNVVTLQFDETTSQTERQQTIALLGGTVEQEIDQLGVVVVAVPDENVQVVPANVTVNNEPDYYVTALADFNIPPSDTRYSEQWALAAMDMPSRWAALPDDARSMIVAVIDSGVCASHPDLQGQLVAGWDYVEDDANPQDELGHGCAIASMIAAQTDNGFGMAGLAPHAKVMPLRVLDKDGIGRYSDVASAIVYAVDNGAQVINISLGGIYDSTVLQNAIDYASQNNVVVVAAAGNSTSTELLYPAAYSSVYAVGAIDRSGDRANFSNYGDAVALWAPGVDVLGAATDGTFYSFSGTSFAAPQAVGVAAVQLAAGQPLFGDALIVASSEPEATSTPEPTIIPETVEPLPRLFASSDAAFAQESSLAVVRSRAVDIDTALLPTIEEAASQSVDSGTILFNFFDDAQFVVDHMSVSPRPGNFEGFVWQGVVEGEPESEVILIADANSNWVGHLTINGIVFEINHLGSGVHTVSEVALHLLASGGQLDYTPVELQGEPVLPEAAAADASTEIDVLVVYTAAARNGAGGAASLESKIDTNVIATNNSFRNHGINFRFNLLDKVEVNYAETGSLSQARNAAANGEIAGLHALRDTYGADIVTLIVETGEPHLCGVAFLMGVPSVTFDDYAYNVVKRSNSCMSGGLLYAHENGHTMGGSHDVANVGGYGSYDYSNGYQDPEGGFSTVMGYPVNGFCENASCRWLLRWSSPQYTHDGKPLGTAEQNDMVRTLNENAYVVANFRARHQTEQVTVQRVVNPSDAGEIVVFIGDSQTPTDATSFPMGTQLTVRAEAQAGYEFNSWAFNGEYNGSNSFIEYPVVTTNNDNEPMVITANFVSAGDGLANDNPSDATLITSLPYQDQLNTATASVNYDENPAVDSTGNSLFSCHRQVGHSVWYLLTGDGSRVSVDTAGSDFDTTLAVYVAEPYVGNEVACSFADTQGGSTGATFNTVAGQAYYIGVGGTRFESGNLILNVAFDEPLALASSNPLNGASNVPTDTDLTLTFNRAASGTLDTAVFTCQPGNIAVSYAVSQVNPFTYTVDVNGSLPPNATCSFTFDANALTDSNGNAVASNDGTLTLSFTTGNGTNNAPQVVSTLPQQNATGVRVNSNIVVELSAPITSQRNSTAIVCQPGNQSVDYTISRAGGTYTFTPSQNLPFDSACVLSVDTQGVTNGQNEALLDADGTQDGVYRLSFQTEKQPQIITTLPREGAVDVSPETDIILVMSELPLNVQPGIQLSLTCNGQRQVDGGFQVSTSIAESYITLNPNNALPTNAQCLLGIPVNAVYDPDGNPLMDNDFSNDGVYTLAFTTGDAEVTPIISTQIDASEPTVPIESSVVSTAVEPATNLSALAWIPAGAWAQDEQAGWQVSGQESATLTLGEPLDLTIMRQPMLAFDSALDVTQGMGAVEVQVGDAPWTTVAVVNSDAQASIDLSAYAGYTVNLRFLWLSGTTTWRISNVTLRDASVAPAAIQTTDVSAPQPDTPDESNPAPTATPGIVIEEAVSAQD